MTARRLAGAVLAVCSLQFCLAMAAFTGSTQSAASLAAATTFPTYPQAVLADGPLFYHRFEDPPGSVTAADSSGNAHPGVYQQNGSTYKTIWPLDDGAGTVAHDLSGVASPNDVTLSGTSWVSGRAGSGLSFNGINSRGTAATTEVDTSATFSVSAWVYLADTTSTRTAVSQPGSLVSGFELGYDQSLGKWSFRMPRSDNPFDTVDEASGGTPTTNTWTYLTGTFGSGTMSLYVDGSLVGTAAHTSLWNATGPVVFGAGLLFGVQYQYWSGRLDDVRTYLGNIGSGATAPLALEVVHGLTSGPSTSWQFNENAGTTTADLSGLQNPGTLTGGATWSTGVRRWGAAAASFDGVDDLVTGALPAVETDAAFSVSAWVYLTSTATSRVAVSQGGTATSGFTLGYDAALNRWAFALPTADSGAAALDRAVATAAPSLNTWVNLTGVHDPSKAGAQLTLYVDGAVVGTAAHTSTWPATGVSVAGAAGFPVDDRFWSGELDDVRLYRRALSAAEAGRLGAVDPANTYLPRSTLGAPGALQGPQAGLQASRGYADGSARNSYNPLRLADPQQFTLECWFRTNVSGGRALVSFASVPLGNSPGGGDRRLFINSSGDIGFGMRGSQSIRTTGHDYADGAWHHLAATADPTLGVVLYVDGVQRATTSFSAGSVANGYWRWNGDTWGGTWVGANFTDYNFQSILDDLAVYSRALTAQEIAIHFHANH